MIKKRYLLIFLLSILSNIVFAQKEKIHYELDNRIKYGIKLSLNNREELKLVKR